tara:strand:+ start:2891 stop:3637 length:747 start_codon:yes stop_codon:yes gene_type:complete
MELIFLILSAFITSSISAVVGMGGGIILLGIMAFIIPQGFLVIALHGIIQLISNSTRTYVFRKHLKKTLLKQFALGAFCGLLLACLLIILFINAFKVNSANEINIEFLKPIIGLFIIWYLYIKKTKQVKRNKTFYKVGIISGLSTVFIGATGPLIAPFFLQDNFSKKNIVANKAACQAISHIGKIPIFIYFFNINYFTHLYILIPLVIVVFLGTYIGKSILSCVPEKIFKMIFKISLTAIAINLILSF